MNHVENSGAKFNYLAMSVGDMLFISTAFSRMATGELSELDFSLRSQQMFEKCLLNADEVPYSMVSNAIEEFYDGLVAHVRHSANTIRLLGTLNEILNRLEDNNE